MCVRRMVNTSIMEMKARIYLTCSILITRGSTSSAACFRKGPTNAEKAPIGVKEVSVGAVVIAETSTGEKYMPILLFGAVPEEQVIRDMLFRFRFCGVVSFISLHAIV